MTEEDDFLAFEYALGTATARDAVGDRIAHDSNFAAQVQAWELRLSSLNDEYAEAPPPALLPIIEGRLFGHMSRRRVFAAVGGLLAASVAAIAVLPLWQPAPVETRLMSPDQTLEISAVVTGGVLRLTRVAGPEAPAGRAYEAWIIRPESAPVSIGLLQDGIETAADVPEGSVVAISIEPQGGSPIGQPTGPVILSATLKI